MNSQLGEKYTVELVALFEQQGQGLYSGQHSLCLTLPCLHYLQKRFSSLQEGSSDPVSLQFPALQKLQENLACILSLKLISDKAIPLPSTATLHVEPFRALHTLVLKKVPLRLVTGLQRLRDQLRTLVVQRCHVGAETNTRLLDNIDEVIVRCCGDEATTFSWNSLKELDLSNNSISKLGDSLQYLPHLEKVNFSHNRIGPVALPPPALTGSLNATDQTLSAPVAVVGVATEGAATGTRSEATGGVATLAVDSVDGTDISYTEGIECIDSVSNLHLGFNSLKRIPKFGSKSKYNLKILNLRNNQLDNIEGISELDRLVELDLTDNMLSKHNALEPLENLHHLAVLTLQGNPLAYHPKHRIKTAKHLSPLVNRNNFRLDGKKLSAAEKKTIPSSQTQFPPIPPAWSPVSNHNFSLAQPLPIHTHHDSPFEGVQPMAGSMPANPSHHHHGGKSVVHFTSAPNTPKDRDSVLEKWKEAQQANIDEDAPVAIPDEPVSKSKAKSKKREQTPVGNHLVNSQELENLKHLRKEIDVGWLDTNPNPGKTQSMSSNSTTDNLLSSASQGTSQPLSTSNDQPVGGGTKSSSVKKAGRRRVSQRHASRKKKKAAVEEKTQSEESGEYGPRASSPVQPAFTGEDTGDCFFVERYESDVEEEGGASTPNHSPKKAAKREKQLMLVISDRFLEEKSSMGDQFIDRWDLNTLQHASVEKKPWRSSQRSSKDAKDEMFNVLSLQFNLERRDRSFRDYVLIEEEVSEDVLSLLNPIIERNQESLSLINRVECLACQRVFDVSQAFEQPTDEPQPLQNSLACRQRSLSKLLCPFCSSPILQYSAATSVLKTPSTFSHGHVDSVWVEPARTVVPSEGKVQSGFSIGSPEDVAPPRRPSPLSQEGTLNADRRNSDEKKRESPLLNGFSDKITGSLEADERRDDISGFAANGESPVKNSSNEIQARSGKSADDLSPWKKPKPSTQPVPPAMAKPSLNPFEGLEDEQETSQDVNALATTSGEGLANGLPEGKSRDSWVDVGATKVGGATGTNPFEDSSGSNPFADFGYGEEEPSAAENAHIPDQPRMGRTRSGAISDAFTRRGMDLPLSPTLESPAETAMTAPTNYRIHDYMSQSRGGGRDDDVITGVTTPSRDLESLLYEQSRYSSAERQRSKGHNATPPARRKPMNFSPVSSRKLHRDAVGGSGSLKRSSGSTHSIDSLKNESGKKWSSLERGVQLRVGGGSGRRGDSAKRNSSPMIFGSNILSKFSPSSPRRSTASSGNDHSGSGGESKWMGKTDKPAESGRGSRRNSGSLKSSSEGAGIKGSSPLALYKDDDPSYIHNNLNLYFDMEVFNVDKKEHFKMVFKSPVMQYGHKLEIPALAVVSSYKFYIFKIVGPESTTAQQWLELIAVHHLKKLLYIDHGVAHQYLRVEFSSESACYTFLIRNDQKCTLCATLLAHIVTDVPKSMFRTVGVVPFTVESIRHPDRALREVIMTRYDKIKSIRSGSTPTDSPDPSLRLHSHINPDSRPASTSSMLDDDELIMYRLVKRVISGDRARRKSEVKTSQMTLVLTERALYLGKENFAQWPLPKVQELPKRDELKPPFSQVRRKDVNDVEQIVLDRDQSDYVSIRFFKEVNAVSMKGEDDSKWTLIMHSSACVNKLVETIKSRWQAEFETTLPVLRK